MSTNTTFRQGALSLMAQLGPHMMAVVTYVDIPSEIWGQKLSGVCRKAVPIPVYDVDAAMQYARLPIVSPGWTAARHIMAILKFGLASYLTNKMPVFQLAFSPQFKDDDVTKGLSRCTSSLKSMVDASKTHNMWDNF